MKSGKAELFYFYFGKVKARVAKLSDCRIGI
jgi:hypothetical protein